MIERGQGNLLRADAEALVNTVNTVGVMGKGIALQFDRAFPENTRVYKRACRAGEVEIGRMLVFERLAAPRFIVNFPTKKHWRQPSRLEYVERGLVDLTDQVRARRMTSIAIPPLGCGLGWLDWRDVKPRIERAFESLPAVRVVLFEPEGAPRSDEMVVAARRPALSPGRAVVIALMRDYLATGYDYRLSLLELQKLAYFAEMAGQPLRLDWRAHVYGPYADTLRKVLNSMEGHYTRGVGDGEHKPETPLELLPGAEEEAAQVLAKDPDSAARRERVCALIEGFETPFGMELLSTVHWVMAHEASAAQSPEGALACVAAWSARKAKLMKAPQVSAAWHRMREQGWA